MTKTCLCYSLALPELAVSSNQLGGSVGSSLTKQEVTLLFAGSWVNRNGATEEREKRSLKLFTN